MRFVQELPKEFKEIAGDILGNLMIERGPHLTPTPIGLQFSVVVNRFTNQLVKAIVGFEVCDAGCSWRSG
jgi:hypothetical protein